MFNNLFKFLKKRFKRRRRAHPAKRRRIRRRPVKKNNKKVLRKRRFKNKTGRKKPPRKKRHPLIKKRRARLAAKALKKPVNRSRPLYKKKSIRLTEAGVVTHYFPRVNAAVLKLRRRVKLGDPVLIKGKTTNYRQTIASLQIDRKMIAAGSPGQEVGLEVLSEVRPGDIVYICS